MPIYEFSCGGCGKTVSVFQRSVTSSRTPVCPECGSTQLARLISSFAFHRGMPEFDLGPEYDDMMDGMDEDDPASIARMAQQMGQDLPPDFDDQFAGMQAGGMGDGGGFDDWDE